MMLSDERSQEARQQAAEERTSLSVAFAFELPFGRSSAAAFPGELIGTPHSSNSFTSNYTTLGGLAVLVLRSPQ